jgi:hypothetical protein
MQKSVDVVTPMPNNIKDIEYLNNSGHLDYDKFKKIKPYHPFSMEVLNYLNSLSIEINKSGRLRNYPDVATFAFFCRKANIMQIKKKLIQPQYVKLGRGIVFHIAPSNVPVNFAYSLIAGLLSGNCNIVRVPTKNYEQVEIIVDAITRISESGEHNEISERIILVRYDRLNNATEYFSSICDVRILWGGDETIGRIRENALLPRAFDITFADRYSMCVINADMYIKEIDPEKIVSGFYNDTFLFDQNACTSPHLIVWLGTKTNVRKAQAIFWEFLHNIVKSKYQHQPIFAVDKVTSFYRQSIGMKNIRLANTKDNLLWRIALGDLSDDIHEFHCNSGYFSEYHASAISEIANIINKKYQTLAYYGLSKEELKEFIYQQKPIGIDRIVPIGKTADFSLIWDGYSLIDTLSRVIEII